ncbi:MAG: CMP-N,N'-diacetyllegionaminic acid synthase [Glaciecola sp.]
MNILITICARGGSKGIPGKNIKVLAGKPLIEYTVKVANKLAEKTGAVIALSTDDKDIRTAAKNCGIETEYERPAFLATDAAGKIDTIKDLIKHEENKKGEKFDYVLDLDLTSPLRTLDDLEKAFELISSNEEALTLFSVNPAERNPYFNMVEKKENGFYALPKKAADGSVMSRQAAPPVYDLNASFYWYKRKFFDADVKSPITDKSMVFVMDHLCFDLDHPIDFEFLDYLLREKKIDFI